MRAQTGPAPMFEEAHVGVFHTPAELGLQKGLHTKEGVGSIQHPSQTGVLGLYGAFLRLMRGP